MATDTLAAIFDVDGERKPFEPTQLLGELAKGEAYPVDAMPPIVRDAVKGIAKMRFVPVALAANSILSACSVAVQGHVNVRLPTGQERPTSLFLTTVATTGDRKSTADGDAMTEIDAYQSDLHKLSAEAANSTFAKLTAWDAAKAAAVQNNKKHGREAIESALIALGPRPNAPMEPTIIARAGTTEGLMRFFDIARPSLGLMSDEGGSWLGGYSMSEDKRLMTAATLSDLWDGKPVQRMTAGEGMKHLYGRRLTFHMMIQPVLAGRLLGDDEFKGQGFLSRLLVAQPESLAGQRIVDPDDIDDPASRQALHAFQDRLASVIRAPMDIDEDTRALTLKPLSLSREAERMWWTFYNSLEARVGKGGDLSDVQGFVGKLPEHAARLAAVLAIFDGGMRVREIDCASLASGIALAEFYLSESLRLFGAKTADPILLDAEHLSEWLRDKWQHNHISVTLVKQNGPSQLRKRTADQVRDVIAALVRNEHLAEKEPKSVLIGGTKFREAWRVLVGRPS